MYKHIMLWLIKSDIITKYFQIVLISANVRLQLNIIIQRLVLLPLCAGMHAYGMCWIYIVLEHKHVHVSTLYLLIW